MRKLVVLLLTMILVISTSVAGLGHAARTVTITFWHTYNTQNNEAKTLREVIIPEFQKQNPGIKVKDLVVPYDDMKRKLLAGAAAETLPELVRMDIIWVPQFANAGLLEPVAKTYAKDFAKMKNNFFPGPLSTAYWKGNYYGLPLDTNTRVLFYNKKLLAKAGLKEAPATWDEFFEAARKVAGGTGNDRIYGFSEGWGDPWNLVPVLYSNGGAITDKTYTKASGYLNSEKSFEILNKLVQANKDGICTKLQGGDPSPWDLLSADRCLFAIDGPWMIDMAAKQWPKLEYGTALIPHGTGVGSASVTGGEDIVMVKNLPTANKAAAWKFMKFMTADWAQIQMGKATQIPVTNSAANSTEMKQFPQLKVFFDQLKTAVARTPHPGYSETQQILIEELTKVVKEGADLRETLNKAAARIDTVLAKPEYNK